MDLKNRDITFPDGQVYCFLASKPVEEISNRSICLLSLRDEKSNYSLWLMEIEDKEIAYFWPYEGDDSRELIIELLEKFLETALDDY